MSIDHESDSASANHGQLGASGPHDQTKPWYRQARPPFVVGLASTILVSGAWQLFHWANALSESVRRHDQEIVTLQQDRTNNQGTRDREIDHLQTDVHRELDAHERRIESLENCACRTK